MLCWRAWKSCVVIPGTDQLLQHPAGSSFAAVASAVVAAAEHAAACGGPGAEASVGAGPDVTGLAEPGSEQGAGEEAAWSEKKVEIVPGQTAVETSVLVVVVVVAVAAAADEPAPGAWTAGADEFAETAVGIIVLGS